MTDTLHIFFKPNKQSWFTDLLSETVHHKFFLMILIFLIPQIGQFLLTLPQHPEPFNMQDNPSVTPLRTPHDTFEILWKFNIILMQLFLHCKKLLVFKICFTCICEYMKMCEYFYHYVFWSRECWRKNGLW